MSPDLVPLSPNFHTVSIFLLREPSRDRNIGCKEDQRGLPAENVKTIGGEPRHFEPQLSDKNGTWAASPPPNYPATPTGGLCASIDGTCINPSKWRVFSGVWARIQKTIATSLPQPIKVLYV
ncbi:hypothetical protein TNCV_3808071 [Trichonephila clavipes]|nr:hypothetical protein TNCV_3808071 [Trichonephila clavipes]